MRIRRDRALLFPILVVVVLALVACEAIGGDHSSPKSVVRAYITAYANKDCEKMRSLKVHIARDLITDGENCGYSNPLESFRIDELLVKNTRDPNIKTVTPIGDFNFSGSFAPTGPRFFFTEKLNGKWYIASIQEFS
jgi:hypothetical protein